MNKSSKTGVAVDVYFVYRNVQGDVTNVTFLLDGQVRGDMIQAGNADEWEYNYHAFGANSLSQCSADRCAIAMLTIVPADSQRRTHVNNTGRNA